MILCTSKYECKILLEFEEQQKERGCIVMFVDDCLEVHCTG